MWESFAKNKKPAENPQNPKKPEKSQAELRTVLEQKLNSTESPLREGAKEYEQAIQNGLFEDQVDEPAGSGEIRKEEMENKLNSLLARTKKMKALLDSKEILPQATPEISSEYTHPNGSKETITISLEQKLQEFLSFYKKNNIDLPPEFEDIVHNLWEANQPATNDEPAMLTRGLEFSNTPTHGLKDRKFREWQ